MDSQSAQIEFLKRYEDLYLEYKKIDKEQIVIKEKQAIWLTGDPKVSKALFLAHGYMGTPSEMMYMAMPFIKEGWTIIGYLIPGHGANSSIANAFKSPRWQDEIAKQIVKPDKKWLKDHLVNSDANAVFDGFNKLATELTAY